VALACGFAALCYAEMASMVPVAGSAYTYAYVTLGELLAWIIGWDLILEYAVGNVAVAVSWSDYFKSLLGGLGLHLPAWLSTTIDHAQKTPGLLESAPHLLGIPIVLNLPAGLIVGVLTILLVLGIQESARVNTAMVILKLVMVVGFIGVGAFYIRPENWTPFTPNGLNGILSGASLIFFAYIGFDAVSTTAEEAKNPQRDIPRAMIATLGICTVLYAAVTLVLTGMVSWKDLGVGDPLAKALQSAGLQALAGILSFGAVVAMTAVLLVFQLGQPRIFMVMARDGLLPEWASRVHPRFRTPYITTILTGVFVGIPAMFVDINEAIEFTNIGTLFAFVLVSVGVIVLRRTDPDRHRPFRCPGVPWLPLLSIVSCGVLMAYLPFITWMRFVVWQVVGVLLYFLYGRRHSRLSASRAKELAWTRTTSR
jgi:APA family basic amino acid/polyamine antiporter